mgnify:CR=1 FL=1
MSSSARPTLHVCIYAKTKHGYVFVLHALSTHPGERSIEVRVKDGAVHADTEEAFEEITGIVAPEGVLELIVMFRSGMTCAGPPPPYDVSTSDEFSGLTVSWPIKCSVGDTKSAAECAWRLLGGF